MAESLAAYREKAKKLEVTEKNAKKEYLVTSEDLDTIDQSKVKHRCTFGNPYRIFQREDVLAMVKEKRGTDGVALVKKNKELSDAETSLSAINKRLKELLSTQKSLQASKESLIERIQELRDDIGEKEPPKKRQKTK